MTLPADYFQMCVENINQFTIMGQLSNQENQQDFHGTDYCHYDKKTIISTQNPCSANLNQHLSSPFVLIVKSVVMICSIIKPKSLFS